MKWTTFVVLVLLAPALAAGGEGAFICDMTALGKLESAQPGELPRVSARDRIFACAGLTGPTLSGWDQLDRDLLFLRAIRLDFPAFGKQYGKIPQSQLERLWKMSRAFQTARKGASVGSNQCQQGSCQTKRSK